MSTLATVFGYGLLSARAAASIAGRFYYATDTSLMYRDNGSTWDALGVGTGSIATDTIWDAAGDLVQGAGADSAAKLSAGAVGDFLGSAGAAAANLWKKPPGYVYDEVFLTSVVTQTGTSEATATAIITSNSVTYNGTDEVEIEAYFPIVTWAPNDNTRFWFYDAAGGGAAASIGEIARFTFTPASHTLQSPAIVKWRGTPSAAAHIYSVRLASGVNGASSAGGGAGGSGAITRAYMKITKAA